MRPTPHRLRPAALLTLALLALALGAASAPALAQALSGHALELRVQQITDQLRCPTCQGISVKDSDAAFSRQIREKVQRMLEEGQSEEQIKAYFVSRYGEWILRAPRKQGLGLVLWITPGAALAIAAGLIGWRVMRGRRRADGSTAAAPADAVTPEQRDRIARDLQRFEDEE